MGGHSDTGEFPRFASLFSYWRDILHGVNEIELEYLSVEWVLPRWDWSIFQLNGCYHDGIGIDPVAAT